MEQLYPSVPMKEILKILREWHSENLIGSEEVNELVNLTKMCMDEN